MFSYRKRKGKAEQFAEILSVSPLLCRGSCDLPGGAWGCPCARGRAGPRAGRPLPPPSWGRRPWPLPVWPASWEGSAAPILGSDPLLSALAHLPPLSVSQLRPACPQVESLWHWWMVLAAVMGGDEEVVLWLVIRKWYKTLILDI